MLFFNPRSGGGKAERFSLADEARARGIEPIELKPGDDLETLVRGAVDRGADALAMAGGDGSQAIVAAIAAELGLPYACVPAGTRNHFALDLGVDRDDVVGALDAFVDGGERTVDLAEVNGRVFVNNVSLGLYAEAVQRKGYRDAKLRTLLDTVPDVLGPDGEQLDLRWTGPGGHAHHSGAAVLVSNNRYRLGRAVGSGTRPRIDDGLLGITVVGAPTGRGEGGRSAAAPMARVVGADLRGRRRSARRRRDRRRGARPRSAAALSHPARESCACASRASTRAPRPRRWLPKASWAGVLELARIALGARPEHRNLNTEGGPNGPDGDHREGAAEPRGGRRPPARRSPTRWPGTTRSSSTAAACASRCTCPTRSTSSSRSRSETTSASSRSSSNGEATSWLARAKEPSRGDVPTRMNADRARALAERLHHGQRHRDGTR